MVHPWRFRVDSLVVSLSLRDGTMVDSWIFRGASIVRPLWFHGPSP